jgi:hypothetical protein
VLLLAAEATTPRTRGKVPARYRKLDHSATRPGGNRLATIDIMLILLGLFSEVSLIVPARPTALLPSVANCSGGGHQRA